MTRSAVGYRARMDSLIRKIDRTRPGEDPELIGHWTRYLCVLVSGLIEVSVSEAFDEYSRVRTPDRRVIRYVDRQLSSFQNPKMQKIVSLASAFDASWGADLETRTLGELKDAIDSIVANRNRIAHGDSVALSFYQLQAYYVSACRVLDMIDAMCGL